MSNRPAQHGGDGAPEAPPEPQGGLARFSPAVRDWFQGAFAAPTPAQSAAWEAISDGGHTLVIAPTGSGKTLSAFLWALDTLTRQPALWTPPAGCQVVYVSPMKALGVDVERNLRAPLVGIDLQARRLGLPERRIRVAVRTGDTPPAERRAFARDPADILITTPESLFLLLTSKARGSLTGVRTVIIDEVHAVAATKRGAHLALTLERLDALLERPAQRIGLSATVRPAQEVARFLAGGRPVHIVDPPSAKAWDLGVVVPVPDLADLGAASEDLSGAASGGSARSSIWPHVEERLVDEIAAHRSTLVFANSRRLAERLTARLNEIWEERSADAPGPAETAETAGGGHDRATRTVDGPRPPGAPPAQLMGQAGSSRGAPPVLARAHHGSVSKEQRATIEDDLKAGRLPVVVATSSLELGIDMGAIDLVVQVEAPPSVASGLQRVGRAGHQVGAVSRGLFFPKHRADLLSSAVVVQRMRAGAIEALRVPANPLDVLAQQIVAMTALDEWTVADLHGAVCRAAPYATLTRPVLESVLDMLAGRYPSEEFGELRPRLVWDRVADTLTGRPGAQRLAVTSGGTIPDRGLFGVFLAGDGAGRRVGELDEEMVYESRVGDVFTLGTSAWRVEDITHDQVIVAPAPGQPGRLPFWRGDTLGRSAELGAALGAYARELAQLPRAAALARARSDGLDEWAADNLVAYLAEQREAAGVLPDERTIVVERFRDELGDWQIAIHSPYGTPVHAPWALVVAARLRERLGIEVHPMYADDGIVLHLPDAGLGETLQDRGADGGALTDLVADLMIDPSEVAAAVTAHLGGSALFAARFRECAARALLLPRRSPGRRQALWQQRQRAAQLLSVASRYPSFPIILESVRECLQDVFDVPALTDLMRDVAERRVHVVAIDTPAPSPFARSLLFGYVAHFLYEGDAPLAERRAAALSLDPDLLAELLGGADAADLADLLDPAVLARTEDELQRRAPDRRCRHAEDVADLVRRLGPITADDVRERTDPARTADVDAWLTALRDARRLIALRISGVDRWAVVEDAARLRDALGAAPPPGVPEALLASVPDSLGDLAARYARTHVPFTAVDLARWLGVGEAVAADVLARLARADRLASGRLRPLAAFDGDGHAPTRPPVDYCDPEVLRLLKRRSLAALRAEVEPVEQVDFARFLPAWHSVGGQGRGPEGVASAIEQLTGAVLPASAWESLVLPARVRDYSPADLDELLASGDVVWQGHGALAGSDGWISFHFADSGPLTLAPPDEGLRADMPRAEISPGDDPRQLHALHALHDV
ncbi:MAG: DEAD/DEAH box helicase, partial [Dermatophilaceae bacterium]